MNTQAQEVASREQQRGSLFTRLRSYFVYVPLVYLYTLVLGILSLLSSLFDGSGRLQHWFARLWARMILKTGSIPIQVEGLENIDPSRPVVYAANHLSALDIPVLYATIPGQFRIMAKKELFRYPVLGWHLKRSGQIPIVFGDAHASVGSLKRAGRALRKGLPLMVFPEGGRSATGQLQPFMGGAFFAAIAEQVPVVPIAIVGTYEMLPMNSFHVLPGPVHLIVGQPIPTTGMRLRDMDKLAAQVRELDADPLGLLAAVRLDAQVLLLEVVAGDDVTQAILGLAVVLDLDAAHQFVVDPPELELVDDRAGQEPGVADALDAHLAEHLGDDDLQVLVVDLDPLRAVDVLDLSQEVALDGLLARDPQDVMRDERSLDQWVAGADAVGTVDPQILAVGHEMLALDAALVTDDDRALAAPFLVQQFHAAIDLGDDRRLLGPPGFEELGDPGQAAGDVLGAAHLARGLGQERAGGDHLACVDLDTGSLGDVLVIEGLALGVLDHDLRVQVALVLDDGASDVAGGVGLDLHGLTLDHVVETHLAADLGEDRDVVRIPLAEHLAAVDLLAVVDDHRRPVGHVVLLELAPLGIEDLDFPVARQGDLLALVVGHDVDADELHFAVALRLDILLLDAAGGHAADVESSHGELGAGLADRLGRDDAHGHAHFDELASRQVHAVAAAADAQRGLAGHRAADLDLLDLHLLELARRGEGDHLVFLDDHLVADRVDDVDPADPAADRLGQAHLDLLALVDHALGDALRGAAVFHGDHDVLGDVGELAGQVAAVGRLEGRVGQPLAGAVGRAEVLEHRQPLAEVGLDGRLDDLARGLGHQSAHAGELANLLDTAAGARLGHQENRVQVDLALARVVAQCFHHLGRDPLTGVGPGVQHLVVPLLVGDDSALVQLVVLLDLFFGLGDDLVLGQRGLEVVGRERQARAGRFAKPEVLHPVQERDRLAPTEDLVAVGDDALKLLLPQGQVVKRHLVVQDVIEDDPPHRGLHYHAGSEFLVAVPFELLVRGQPQLDQGVDANLALAVSQEDLVGGGEDHGLALLTDPADRQVVRPHDDVLGRADDRVAVGGAEDVVGRHHQGHGLDLGFDRKRQVHGHLVAVEVGVEPLADQGVNPDRVAFDEHGLERLDAHTVQRRRPVEQDRVIADDLLEDIPDLFASALEHLLGRLDRVGVSQLLEAADDEGLKQLQRDLLGQAALVQLQVRADDDHRPRRVIDALAQQVLAESTLLALDHVGQRLEGPVG